MAEDKGGLTRRSFLNFAVKGATAIALGDAVGHVVNLGNSPRPKDTPPTTTPKELPPVVDLQAVVPYEYGPTSEQFIERAAAIIQKMHDAIAASNDPLINPDLSEVFFLKEMPGYHDFQPPTLATILKNIASNIRDGYIKFEIKREPGLSYAMATSSQLTVENNLPLVGTTTTYINNEGVEKGQYPSVGPQSGKVPITDAGLAVLAVYEACHRYNKMAEVSMLQRRDPRIEHAQVLTPDSVLKSITDFDKDERQRGFRFAADNNIVQLALIRSLAALAGNPQARVKGLERAMDWDLWKNAQSILPGDLNGTLRFMHATSVGAGY